MIDTGHNTITVSIGVTKNVGNFESVRIDASATIKDVDPSDKAEWDKAWKLVDDQVEIKLSELGD